jgi:alpha-ribazole phosphatase
VRLLLIRHGESAGNAADRIQGIREEPLTATGRAQAASLGQRLRQGYEIRAVYSSSLSRAQETAEIIAAALGLSVIADDRLQEYDCGVVTGLCHGEVQAQYPEIARRWAEDSWQVPIPGEEGLEVFQKRILAAMDDIAVRHSQEDTVAVVAHGGVWSIYLASLVGLDVNRRQPWMFGNGSLSIVLLGSTRPRIALLNDTCHLDHAV